MGSREVLELLGPSGVKELVGHVAGLLLELVLELLTRQVLVHEALAGEVEPQVAVVADDAATADAGAATHVVDHRGVPLLQGHACPGSHLVAVARGGVVALDVHRGVHDGHLVLHDGGHEVLEHGGVVSIVAAGEDDAALGGCLDVLAGGSVAGVDAAAAAVLHDELRAEVAVADVHVAGGLGLSQRVGHHLRKVGDADGGGVGGQGLLRPVIALKHGVEKREEVVRAVLLGDLGEALGGDVGVRRGDEPVENVLHLVFPAHEDGQAVVVEALVHVLLGQLVLVHEALAAAPGLLHLAANDSAALAGGVLGLRLLESQDGRTLLRSGADGAAAGVTHAHDDDVGLDLFLHHVVGDLGLRGQPGAVVGGGGDLGLGGLVGDGDTGQGGAGGNGGTGQTCALDERPAGDIAHGGSFPWNVACRAVACTLRAVRAACRVACRR